MNLKASTIRFYEGHLEQHIVPALGVRPITDLRRADCRDLVTACRTKGLKVTTVRGIARMLSTILTQAVEDELLPANPALRLGRYLPEWVFPSVTGTALDESNVRKAFNRVLDAAWLHRRGPHQMRHTFASLLLQDGAAITYVSRQLGHKDASITLRVYAHWVPDASAVRAVDWLDDTQPSATQTQPTSRSEEWRSALSALNGVVSRVGIEPTTRRLRDDHEGCPLRSAA